MLNYLKGSGMRITLVATTLLVSLPMFAESLCEAVQHSLISNPEVIFNSSKEFLVNSKLSGQAYPGEQGGIFNQLKFNPPEEPKLKSPGVANDLASGVVKQYLLVMLNEKLLELARTNLRVNRTVYLALKSQESSGIKARIEQKKVARLLAQAESNLIAVQANLHEARKQYAKVVGKWPSKLIWPRVPANTDLPSSVGEAIEQGLDNYLSLVSSQHGINSNPDVLALGFSEKHVTSKIKKRSMVELSKSIRASWDDWTATGLKLNLVRKNLAMVTQARDANQDKFKEGKCTTLDLLNSQKLYYQTQIEYDRREYRELAARYEILDSIGRLLPFINTSVPEGLANDDTGNSFDPVNLTEMDKISSPYPDYKPQFGSDIAMSMEIPELATKNADAPLSSAWYVSAGTFKNKANAIALVNRLKGLGFIVFIDTQPKGSSVLIGPYDYPRHAAIGMERLRDIAHVQGILVKAKQAVRYG
jgi:adhesin transport system outer membrane protein